MIFRKVKLILLNLSLLLCAILCGLLIFEGFIRILKPELRDIVDAQFQSHAYRIHANPRNAAYTRMHPDTRGRHAVIYNSLGIRQHREFSPRNVSKKFRIGFIGDSYTENVRMEAPYSFSEPLDYLLNQAGVPAEVLNFGTDGYGTDQVYLQYLDEIADIDLDMVIYMYCFNDIKDILVNRLFDVSADGELQYLPRHKNEVFIKMIRRFYLTYFLMGVFSQYSDLSQSYDPKTIVTKKQKREKYGYALDIDIAKPSKKIQPALIIFRKLISRLRDETRRRHQDFVVMIVPKEAEKAQEIKRVLQELDIKTIDPISFFQAQPQEQREFYFRNDPHWNEEGNKIAAVYLFKYLAEQLKLTPAGEEFIRKNLFDYYSAFTPTHVSTSWTQPGAADNAKKEKIRNKYLEIELR